MVLLRKSPELATQLGFTFKEEFRRCLCLDCASCDFERASKCGGLFYFRLVPVCTYFGILLHFALGFWISQNYGESMKAKQDYFHRIRDSKRTLRNHNAATIIWQ